MSTTAAPHTSAATARRRIRVLIVDDSALVRSLLSDILSSDRSIEVVGVAGDAHVAREKIKQLNPDVITLDVEMPKMDGITFLRNLMRLRPMPVVMVSSLTERGADVTLDALAIGAVDYLSKPRIDLAATLKDYGEELIEKIKTAAQASVRALDPRRAAAAGTAGLAHGAAAHGTAGPAHGTAGPAHGTAGLAHGTAGLAHGAAGPAHGTAGPAYGAAAPAHDADAVLPKAPPARQLRTTDRIIAIGASTGGTEAIKEVLIRLPPDAPGVVIAQHIPKAFSTPFARRMNDCSHVTVYEAEDGQQVLAGHVYIAPGDRHLMVVRDGARYVCRLDDGVPVNRHKPSVDVLFRSVAQNAGANAIGVLLTGMGKDGARGLKEMLDAGSRTIAQDEATSVVWGMPGEAVSLGAAQHVLPLESVTAKILSLADAMDITRSAREP